ncbi:MAG: hypothetical protein AAF587_40620 [Bacteroidota bacterium]
MSRFAIVQMRFSDEGELISLELYNSEPNDSFPSSIFEIKSLQKLHVRGTQCCDPDGSCKNFLFLPEKINQLENLEELYWNNYSARLPESIIQMGGLKRLSLGLNRFSNSNSALIFQIPNLETLYLNNCLYDSTVLSIENIAQLKSLKEIHIAGNQLSEDYIQTLRKEFPFIEIID